MSRGHRTVSRVKTDETLKSIYSLPFYSDHKRNFGPHKWTDRPFYSSPEMVLFSVISLF